ncbi:NAD-dependent epimerase/dehydratase [Melioribacter roseus P3M-2]|uniref:NAD-dependent epimerase/dehydratase n=1 Tax=Melioribacter roseus (strain DSM 23840 / JCM 17771 / VKM B-2668 / P3M-2) TaxID=1191523 RepID=I6Z5F3_MELRP|nr:NAD-dependent epimerase/dehydratase family protein [Melioribacter roseus]AFN74390.1 NAD-dependent epimerase/dehydratase [Melioribacter roseus P3M-2]
MKFHLVTGACGFVGRNTVKQLLKRTGDYVIMVDDLSVGTHPTTWLGDPVSKKLKDIEVFGKDERLFFFRTDIRKFLNKLQEDADWLKREYGLKIERFGDVFHFAAIVGGRAKIEGDPMAVALDLSIDAEFFNWIAKSKPERVLYPSSSAAYPINLQAEGNAVALKESYIDINGYTLGKPDMTYGWTKLTGEYLAKIAAEHYGISIVCIRPFSGYGEDQDLSYPVPAIATRAARKEDPFEVWGTGQQGRDFVHIDDVMDCMFLAMDKIHDGTAINIGSGKLTSFIELIQLFTKFAGYSPAIKPLTDKPMGVHSRYSDMSFVKQLLGWEPRISLEEGMRRVYDVAVERIKNNK